MFIFLVLLTFVFTLKHVVNILGENEESISDLLRLDTITEGSILFNTKLVRMERENHETI